MTLTEDDGKLIAALVRNIVTEVVQAEIQALAAATIETLKPYADCMVEMEKSMRLILDGETLVEKSMLNMLEAFSKANGAHEGDEWKAGY